MEDRPTLSSFKQNKKVGDERSFFFEPHSVLIELYAMFYL